MLTTFRWFTLEDILGAAPRESRIRCPEWIYNISVAIWQDTGRGFSGEKKVRAAVMRKVPVQAARQESCGYFAIVLVEDQDFRATTTPAVCGTARVARDALAMDENNAVHA